VFQTSRNSRLKLIYDKLIAPHESTLNYDDKGGLGRVCYKRKYAHMTSDYNLQLKGYLPYCSISLIPKAFYRGLLAFPFAKKSPYLGLMNHK